MAQCLFKGLLFSIFLIGSFSHSHAWLTIEEEQAIVDGAQAPEDVLSIVNPILAANSKCFVPAEQKQISIGLEKIFQVLRKALVEKGINYKHDVLVKDHIDINDISLRLITFLVCKSNDPNREDLEESIANKTQSILPISIILLVDYLKTIKEKLDVQPELGVGSRKVLLIDCLKNQSSRSSVNGAVQSFPYLCLSGIIADEWVIFYSSVIQFPPHQESAWNYQDVSAYMYHSKINGFIDEQSLNCIKPIACFLLKSPNAIGEEINDDNYLSVIGSRPNFNRKHRSIKQRALNGDDSALQLIYELLRVIRSCGLWNIGSHNTIMTGDNEVTFWGIVSPAMGGAKSENFFHNNSQEVINNSGQGIKEFLAFFGFVRRDSDVSDELRDRLLDFGAEDLIGIYSLEQRPEDLEEFLKQMYKS